MGGLLEWGGERGEADGRGVEEERKALPTATQDVPTCPPPNRGNAEVVGKAANGRRRSAGMGEEATTTGGGGGGGGGVFSFASSSSSSSTSVEDGGCRDMPGKPEEEDEGEESGKEDGGKESGEGNTTAAVRGDA